MDPLNLTEPAKIKIAATYNSAADHFDDAALAFLELYGRRTVERLNLQRGVFVLDVGCGTGASALPAAEVVGAEGKVLGVDLAENLLVQARTKALKRNLHNIEFRLGDMTALGFPDNHFDAVVSVFSIFFVPDMESQARELWRMVKPGGKLALTIWGPAFWEPVYSVWRAAVKAERPDLYSASNPWDRISLPEQVQQFLSAAGIHGSEVIPESGRQHLRSPEDWWTMVLGSGLRGTVDTVGAATATRIHDQTVNWVRDNNVQAVQTNVNYAVAVKGGE